MTLTTKKLVKYVEKGRLSRIKRYLRDKKSEIISEHPQLKRDDAWMDVIRVKSRKHCYGDETTLLHLAASIGDERVLRYLLKMGFGRRQGHRPQETDMKTPLHLVVERCKRTLKERGSSKALEDFQDYVKPVLDACPKALEVKNQLGERGSLVLDELQTDIANDRVGQKREDERGTRESDSDNGEDFKDSERKWREKLMDECDFESATTFGKFKEDWEDGWEEERCRETFKEFAARIEREYRDRFQTKFISDNKRANKRRKDTEEAASAPNNRLGKEIDLEKHKQYEEMRRLLKLKDAKLDYEKRYEEFFADSDRVVSLEDIPWLKRVRGKDSVEDVGKLVQDMIEICTWTVERADKDKERKVQIKRWHPDKVAQKIRVNKDDEEIVSRVVKELSQALNLMKPG